mgnify:CR=1 FL=1
MISNSLYTDKSGKLAVKPEAIQLRKYNDIRNFVSMLEYNKIPYNKHILTIMREEEDKLVEKFYGLTNTITSTLVKYTDESTRRILATKFQNFKLGPYFQNADMNMQYDRIEAAYLVKHNLLTSIGIDRAPKIVLEGFEDFTRGLKNYINATMSSSLPLKTISNAFLKIWEVYTIFDNLIPARSTRFRTFHICEAPGQMIIATKYFIEKKRPKLVDYDWYANSLNPYSAENIKTFGVGGVFGDEYKLIAKNPTKWLWGADDTGDVTRPTNIKWFKERISQWGGADLIVGDGGLKTGLAPVMLQKLDLAQAITVLACSKKGGKCIIKHFTPYIKRDVETKKSTGLFLGFLYLYYLAFEKVSLHKPYTSNPDSGEFYVVGEGFRGIEEDELERLYKMLEQFELNDGLIPRSGMPETFLAQINGFLERMSTLNSMAIEKQNLLLTCYKEDKNPKMKKYLKCDRFLSLDNLQNIQRPRFEEWIKRYGFS